MSNMITSLEELENELFGNSVIDDMTSFFSTEEIEEYGLQSLVDDNDDDNYEHYMVEAQRYLGEARSIEQLTNQMLDEYYIRLKVATELKTQIGNEDFDPEAYAMEKSNFKEKSKKVLTAIAEGFKRLMMWVANFVKGLMTKLKKLGIDKKVAAIGEKIKDVDKSAEIWNKKSKFNVPISKYRKPEASQELFKKIIGKKPSSWIGELTKSAIVKIKEFFTSKNEIRQMFDTIYGDAPNSDELWEKFTSTGSTSDSKSIIFTSEELSISDFLGGVGEIVKGANGHLASLKAIGSSLKDFKGEMKNIISALKSADADNEKIKGIKAIRGLAQQVSTLSMAFQGYHIKYILTAVKAVNSASKPSKGNKENK